MAVARFTPRAGNRLSEGAPAPEAPVDMFRETGRQAPIQSYVEAHQGPRQQMEALAGGLVMRLMSEEDAVAFVPNLCGNAG